MSSTEANPAKTFATGESDAHVATGPSKLRLRAASVALPVVFLVIVIFFSIMRPEIFATWSNARTLMLTQSVPAIFAIALLFPLVVGQFDLSAGANLGFGLIIVTGMPHTFGWPLGPSIILALLATASIGVINGLLVAYLDLNALVVTLAMSSLVTGAVLYFTKGAVFYSDIPESLSWFAGSFFSIPKPMIALVLVALISWFFLEHTPAGRYLYAAGGSKAAAALAGVPVKRLTVMAFVLSGLLAGVAGVIQASILRAGNPTVGPAFLLPGFTAAFLGATAIKPGVFNVPGTVLGVFTVSTGIVGLNMMGVPFFIEPIFAGGALLIAIVASRFLRVHES
jgi:ribose transport system permease protein